MTSWKDEIPADLPRARMRDEAIRRGAVRRQRRHRTHVRLTAGVGVLVAVMIGLVTAPLRSDERRLPETDLRTGPAAPAPAPTSGATTAPPIPAGPGGKIAFIRRTAPEDPSPKVVVMNADGTEQVQIAETTRGSDLRWSPDGRRFAFTDVGGIYVMNADGTGEKRISSESTDMWPSWSPDSTSLAFRGLRNGGDGIYVMKDDGTGVRRLADGLVGRPAWSPDGKRIAFSDEYGSGRDIYVMNADGSGRRQLTTTGFADEPAWSPEGTRITYRGGSEILVVSVDGGASRSLASPGGTMALDPQGSGAHKLAISGGEPAEPAWSPDGRRIAYALLQSGSHCAIWVMNADGSGQTGLTDGSVCDGSVTWQPTPR